MYDHRFYETIRDGARASAAEVVPMLRELIDPSTVVDVGCGEGWWGRAFADAGCKVTGLESARTPRSGLAEAGQPVYDVDVSWPLPHYLGGPWDLALCLEVAEHLPAAYADQLVANLCKAAPVVVFSAAIPGQGGVGHVNEQWPAYWVEKFNQHGFHVSGALRWAIWDNPQVENWYRQNLLLATADTDRFEWLFRGPAAAPLPVVHPVLWDSRRPDL